MTTPLPAVPEIREPHWALRVFYAVAVLSGAAILTASMAPTIVQAPALTAASVALFVAFGTVCTWLLNKIQRSPPLGSEARILAVLWGAAAAVGYALLANRAIYNHLAARGEADGWALFAPFTEEPLKCLGVVVVLLLAVSHPRIALDGLVAGSFVGLGFEVVENVVQSLTNAITSSPAGHPSQWASLITDVIHEVVRRSWTGHIVITGIAGFGIAYAMGAVHRSATRRVTVAAALVGLAVAGHLLWNSHRFGVFYVLGQFGILAVYLWLIRIGRRQQPVRDSAASPQS